MDANGENLICEDFHKSSLGDVWVASPRVRALTEAGPVMAAMLRSVLEELDDPDGRLGALKMRMELAGLRALLARIDAAGKR